MWHRELTEVDVTGLEAERATRHFRYADPFGKEAAGFVIRWRGELRAYRNLCPHWAVPIDGGAGEVWDGDGEELMCVMHGALFDPETGRCTFGPADGEGLERFELEVSGDGRRARVMRRSGLSLG